MKVGTCAVLWSLGLLMGIGACSASDKGETGADNADGDDDEQVATPEVVEIFSWWTQPGEAEALQALIDVYQDDTQGGRVFNAAADSLKVPRSTLRRRVEALEARAGIPGEQWIELRYEDIFDRHRVLLRRRGRAQWGTTLAKAGSKRRSTT